MTVIATSPPSLTEDQRILLSIVSTDHTGARRSIARAMGLKKDEFYQVAKNAIDAGYLYQSSNELRLTIRGEEILDAVEATEGRA